METGGPLRVGVLGGAGWLGGAIAKAIVGAGVVEPENLSLSYRSERPYRFNRSSWTSDNQALADRSDVIVLSVRPADWPTLNVDAKGKLLISVMAGIRLSALCAHHRTDRVVRALPNAAAEVRKSYTPWIATAGLRKDDRAIVRSIFDACGAQDEVCEEAEIDYLTGLTGSGPAFPALLAEAMMTDAISHGLSPEIAKRAVNTLMVGAGRLLEQRDDCPSETVQTFLDYRGTTAAAIEEMRAAGFDDAVSRGLTAALRKSVGMGEAS
ncbi:pyrroline-5-carboxylate reductase [Ensifer sp. NM-2]|uniref:pyrroline-5-carboxylate reductase family protein n=1 Tax=unclassified Ensifer TaxID=2633371 RepID=UPI00070CA92C|nr:MULTISPECIES: pyrroline-5-carboxylate reductase dimerization domain-containing protein [unclassified Ensifer]KQU84479.1 pyrroline-5-carboxylate reductase [Ensifer sp. Root31]PSS64259.1 pyrroline-5-carboxylate reductase [Ensifer sp. NM-2]